MNIWYTMYSYYFVQTLHIFHFVYNFLMIKHNIVFDKFIANWIVCIQISTSVGVYVYSSLLPLSSNVCIISLHLRHSFTKFWHIFFYQMFRESKLTYFQWFLRFIEVDKIIRTVHTWGVHVILRRPCILLVFKNYQKIIVNVLKNIAVRSRCILIIILY